MGPTLLASYWLLVWIQTLCFIPNTQSEANIYQSICCRSCNGNNQLSAESGVKAFFFSRSNSRTQCLPTPWLWPSHGLYVNQAVWKKKKNQLSVNQTWSRGFSHPRWVRRRRGGRGRPVCERKRIRANCAFVCESVCDEKKAKCVVCFAVLECRS